MATAKTPRVAEDEKKTPKVVRRRKGTKNVEEVDPHPGQGQQASASEAAPDAPDAPDEPAAGEPTEADLAALLPPEIDDDLPAPVVLPKPAAKKKPAVVKKKPAVVAAVKPEPQKAKKPKKVNKAIERAELTPKRKKPKVEAAASGGRNAIAKVHLSDAEARRVDIARGGIERSEWIRTTVLNVARTGMPDVDQKIMLLDELSARNVVVNFRMYPAEVVEIDGSRGRQPRAAWMREAILRVAYPLTRKAA